MIVINSISHAFLAIHHLKANLHSWNNCYLFADFIKRFRLSWESTQFRPIVICGYALIWCELVLRGINEAKISLIE